MWQWHPGATESQATRYPRLLSSSAGGSYYLLPDDRDPESLSLDCSLFTDAPAEIIPFQQANVVLLVPYLILLLLYESALVLSVWIAVVKDNVFAVVAGNAVVLVVTSLVELHLRKEIDDVERQGFLKLSQELVTVVGVPFAVIAYGTAGTWLLTLWHKELYNLVKLPWMLVLRGWIFVEVAATGACVVWYFCKLRHHNSTRPVPDAVRLLSSILRGRELEDVKYTDGTLACEQAALLQYQQRNLLVLSGEIVRLRDSLSKFEQTDRGGKFDVDAVALLGLREQELRGVTAERDQLQGEVRLTRRDIAEYSAEIAKSSTDVDNLLVENDRLRAIVDEWSTHAAKVERAHETERLANVEQRNARSLSPKSASATHSS